MAINVQCPACGAKRSLSDEFRGHSVTCPKCGGKFTPTTASESSETALLPPRSKTTPTPGPRLVPPPPTAATAETSSRLQPAPEPSVSDRVEVERFRKRRSERESALPPRSGEARAIKVAAREYKVLTRKNLWFTDKFSAEGLEEALNSFGQQGWKLKSTVVLQVTDREGDREELIVILER